MTTHDESELRIVEVTGPLAPLKLPGKLEPMKRRPAPTRAQALEALQAAKGGASLIERVPALGQIGAWGEVASWNACEATGAAAGIPFFWGCDFLGDQYTMADGAAYCLPFFAGKETIDGVVPPGNSVGAGQVWCYFNAPAESLYLFVVQVDATLTDPASLECLIDSNSPYPLGYVSIAAGGWVNAPFVVNLPAGQYKFVIAQDSGGVYFQNLTAWTIPIFQL